MISLICLLVLASLKEACLGATLNSQLSPEVIQLRLNQSLQMKSYMNSSAPPCDDFYQYACGNWDARHPLEDDDDEIDTFSKLATGDMEVWTKILQNPTDQGNPRDAFNKAKDFFQSCMDTEKVEKLDVTPLLDYLKDLGSWPAVDSSWSPDANSWLKLHAEMERMDEEKLISWSRRKDIFDASRKSLYLLYPQMTLGYRRYYSSKSEIFIAYKAYLMAALKAFNVPENRIKSEFNDILNFELKMSEIVVEFADYINDIKNYKVTTLGDLEKDFTSIDWKEYLKLYYRQDSFNSSERVIIHGNYLQNLDTLLKNTPKRTIFNYLGWHITSELMLLLGPKFENIRRDMESVTSGVKADKPRLEQCIEKTKTFFEAAVGSEYIKTKFNQKAREDATILLNSVKNSFNIFVDEAEWIDNDSKKNVKLKVEHLGIEVGYPDIILNATKVNELYENITIKADNYFGNTVQLLTAGIHLEWPIHFTSVNAVFDTVKMYITAMMFQPPFYHKDLPKFMNFAGIGSVTAHELSHAFDTDNIIYDYKGEANNWFSNASLATYKEKEKCFVEKYGNYSLNGVKLDGERVLGEVVADDVGIKAAYLAYQTWIKQNENSTKINKEKLVGFTESKEKMFFLSYAQLFCSHIQESSFPRKFEMDTHSIQKYRVNGVLSNLKSFSDAYGCPVGSGMNPARKCVVW